jgi:hypothetical protein
MSGRGLRTRLGRLESQMIPRRRPRIVVRYEGPGSERFPQATEAEMEEGDVLTVQFVGGCEGRPKTHCRRAASGLQECQELCQGMEISRPDVNEQQVSYRRKAQS